MEYVIRVGMDAINKIITDGNDHVVDAISSKLSRNLDNQNMYIGAGQNTHHTQYRQ